MFVKPEPKSETGFVILFTCGTKTKTRYIFWKWKNDLNQEFIWVPNWSTFSLVWRIQPTTETILIYFAEPEGDVLHKSKELPNTGFHSQAQLTNSFCT
jgi:hypothetical protein